MIEKVVDSIYLNDFELEGGTAFLIYLYKEGHDNKTELRSIIFTAIIGQDEDYLDIEKEAEVITPQLPVIIRFNSNIESVLHHNEIPYDVHEIGLSKLINDWRPKFSLDMDRVETELNRSVIPIKVDQGNRVIRNAIIVI